jgi:hypothetical protein
VIHLDRKTYRHDPGVLELEGELGFTLRITYRVIRLWEVDPAPILALGAPGLLPFVPLMAGNPVELLLSSKEKLAVAPEALAAPDVKRELLAIQAVLAGRAGRAGRVIGDCEFLEKLSWEIRRMGDNYFLDLLRKEGIAIGHVEGRQEGQAEEARRLLRRILARRFAPLPAEIASEIERLAELENIEELERLTEAAAVLPDLEAFLALLRGR